MKTTHPFRAELRALTRLAVPLAVAQGGQALMGVVDTAVLGRAGPVPMAGTGLGNSLFFGMAVFAMGVMLGLDPMASQAFGAGDRGRARRLLTQGAWLAGGLTLLFALPIAAAPLLFQAIGIAPDVAQAASEYVWWRLPGLPFLLLYYGGRAYLQAAGATRPMVIAVVVANVVNVPLDVLLVFGGADLPALAGPLRLVPPMGAAGAAVATSLCTALQAAILFRAAVAVPQDGHAPAPRRPDRAELRTAVRLGTPIGLHMGAEVGIFALVSLLAGRLGAEASAAHQLALSVASLTFTVAVGLGQGGSVRVGLAVGARDRLGARRAGLAAFAGGATFMSGAALAFALFPGAIARLMTDAPAVIATAAPVLRVAALFQISDGIQGIGAGVLRGAGETRFTFAANMVGHWAIGLPASLLFAFTLGGGVTGLWVGFCFGLTTVAVALLARFLRVSSREIAPIEARRAVA